MSLACSEAHHQGAKAIRVYAAQHIRKGPPLVSKKDALERFLFYVVTFDHLSGLFIRWMHEIYPKDLGNIKPDVPKFSATISLAHYFFSGHYTLE